MKIFRILPFVYSFWLPVQASGGAPNGRLLQEGTTESSVASVSGEEEFCKAASKGVSYRTNKSITVRYFYELLTPNDPLRAGSSVEIAILHHLVENLILEKCNSPSNQLPTTTLNVVRGTSVDGTSIVSGCTNLVGELPEGMGCYRMIGSNTVYLDEAAEVDPERVQEDTTTFLYDALRTGEIQLGKDKGIYGFVPLPESLLWSDTADTDTTTTTTTGPTAQKATTGTTNEAKPLSDVTVFGIILIALAGTVAMAILIYIWSTGRNTVEKDVEEEFSLVDSAILDRYDNLRVLVARCSGSEQDVTEDIETDFRRPKQNHAVNPFAPREGRTLTWRNVNMSLCGKGVNPDKTILDNVWGEVPKGETTAIMGSSGSGKSSLLNVLAGRTRSCGDLTVEADVHLDQFLVNPLDIKVRKSIAFVAQDDSLQITATPREAIRFSAQLRLPRSTTEDELDTLTTEMLSELGLTECADTVVGGPLLKGISGGERKRTSVGVELVVKPAMVFLDEPSSGLDSFSALQCVQVLRKVANAGASVLFTIHQPSSDIFASFDHLILLEQGRLLYNGPAASVADYFEERGHPCPDNYNPADWVLTVAQTTPLSELQESGFIPEDKLVAGDPDDWNLSEQPSFQDTTEHSDRVPGYLTQTRLLFKREIRNVKRNPAVFSARIVINVVMSFFLGAIFTGVGETDSAVFTNLSSHFGAMMTSCVLIMLATGQSALLAFPSERPVFLREYTTDHYSVASYFTARLVIDAGVTSILSLCLIGLAYRIVRFQGPFMDFYFANFFLALLCGALAHIIGALAGGDSKLAAESLPALFTPQILFSGFLITPDLIPVWIRWLQHICPLSYVIKILLVTEFYECSSAPIAALNCENLIENTGANVDDVWWYWIVLAAQFLAFRIIALFLLRRSAQQFY